MCGIIGYCGGGQALPLLLQGLKRLEYRGYDSSGVALLGPGGKLAIFKSAGRIDNLAAAIAPGARGTLGIGHTRWATHGKPSHENAHPHLDCTGGVAVVHNGIVENYRELKAGLVRAGHRFTSQTDSEVIPHLLEQQMLQGATLEEALRRTGAMLRGAHAIVAVSAGSPDTMAGLRIGHAGGLAVGYAEGAVFFASDVPAIQGEAERVLHLASGEMAVARGGQAHVTTLEGTPVHRRAVSLSRDPMSAAKGPYKHFMLKEIMEQPETLVSALRDRIDFQDMRIALDGFPFDAAQVRSFDRVVLAGMGTSFHAAQVGRMFMERLAHMPAEAENASEYRYRDPVVSPKTLLVTVGQSGETVDTLVAMAEAKQRGLPIVTVCNVAGSEATRVADYAMLVQAGPEVAVASTKTYVGSLVCLYLLAAYLGQERGSLDKEQVRRVIEDAVLLPNLMGQALEQTQQYETIARRYAHAQSALVLGRGLNYPTAMEGALKLKEVSYMHAEGYPAGEMKHGPIALIDEHTPVIAVALRDRLREKMLSSIEQVRARGGRVIAIATAGDEEMAQKATDVVYVPDAPELLTPLLAVVPLQLLAYYIAVRRGADVDQPRNLAKTVTVE